MGKIWSRRAQAGGGSSARISPLYFRNDPSWSVFIDRFFLQRVPDLFDRSTLHRCSNHVLSRCFSTGRNNCAALVIYSLGMFQKVGQRMPPPGRIVKYA